MKAVLILVLFAVSSCASEKLLSVQSATRLTFDQNIGSDVSLNTMFLDEEGRGVELRRYFGESPIVMALGYYECPMLCNLVLNGIVQAFQQIKGSSPELIFVSINPDETPALAAAKKETYLRRYGRRNAAAGWHFLTGDGAQVQRLANEVGFHYAYDPINKQYAHPSGIVILTPDGRIFRYFFGVSYPAHALELALKQARNGERGERSPPLLMLCSQFMTLTGRYSAAIMHSVRTLAVLSMVALAGFMLVWSRRRGPNE
jgi:protein SCO1/2